MSDKLPRRRRFLQSLALGVGVGVAGCSTNDDGSTGTPGESPADTPPSTTASPTDETTEPPNVDDLQYAAPRAVDDFDAVVEERKLAALRQVLAADGVGSQVTEAVSSTAYHRIYDGVDFVEILAPHEMSVTGSLDGGQHTIEFGDIRQIRGLVDRRNDRLLKVDVRTREPHVIERSYDGLNMDTVNAALEHPDVAAALEGKDWYVLAADYSIITAYSEEYPIGVVTPVLFNWNNDQGELVAVGAAVTTKTFNDQIEENEVLDVYRPTSESPDPLADIVAEVQNTDPGDYREGTIDPPGAMDDENWEIRRPSQTIEQGDWTVTWENTLHDAYRVEASYKGKPVFGRETKVPWMLSDYEPFGMAGPGTPSGRRNWHFWDTLGFTGPGVIEKHDFADGFRIRGTYHTGSLDHWEWRFGQNWAPYRYLIDWNFHDDGTVDVTSRHPTTGFRTTNGYPKYTFHFAVDPAFESATVSTDDGSGWSAVTEESRIDRSNVDRIRVENADGPERLVVERPGMRTYALQYDPELVEYEQTLDGVAAEMLTDREYLDPENYLRGNSVDGERLYLRMYSDRDTSQGTHATTDPFAFRFTMRAENY
ncbi:hypothetical protein SAMN04487948_103369 [Halogranum amylolyticum]|uniref:Uncharacterized protein n=1 Tax=Halogranum amylolyticum TaxID=660520 RepID=A0A1H8QXN2_9EURY|nr:hypothetical protein [Halogranum amylolyticum]SEO58816.1 hypothetical protein SAMN04487948_103369 [Halogranum amylolyticum]